MPRYTNAADGSLMLHFGQGDIAVCTARCAESTHDDELIFVIQSEPHEVGSPANLEGKPSDQCDTALRMAFDNVGSLDVVLGALLRLRSGLPDALPLKLDPLLLHLRQRVRRAQR